MAITKYDLDINKQAIIKPVVILRQGDHDIDTMQVSLSVANEPMDLTGATVTFMGNTANGRQIIDDAHVKIIDAKGGVFEYVFPSEASSDIGEYKVAYFSIILGNGQSSTMDFRVQVLSGVDISAPAASEYVSHYDTMVTELNSAYDSFVNETDDKMASTVSSLATSAATVLDSALARVNDIDSTANKASSAASNAVSMASSVASTVTSQASYINSVASSAASNVSSVAASVVNKLNNLSIGGRNLLLGTADFSGGSSRWTALTTVTTDRYRGTLISSSSGAYGRPSYTIQNAGILQVGKTYTFSIYARNTSDTDAIVTRDYNANIVTPAGYEMKLPAHTDWTRVSSTFTVKNDPTTSTDGLRWNTHNSVTNGTVQFAGYKLEEGNVATDWTPAPEDADNTFLKKSGDTVTGDLMFQGSSGLKQTGVNQITDELVMTNGRVDVLPLDPSITDLNDLIYSGEWYIGSYNQANATANNPGSYVKAYDILKFLYGDTYAFLSTIRVSSNLKSTDTSRHWGRVEQEATVYTTGSSSSVLFKAYRIGSNETGNDQPLTWGDWDIIPVHELIGTIANVDGTNSKWTNNAYNWRIIGNTLTISHTGNITTTTAISAKSDFNISGASTGLAQLMNWGGGAKRGSTARIYSDQFGGMMIATINPSNGQVQGHTLNAITSGTSVWAVFSQEGIVTLRYPSTNPATRLFPSDWTDEQIANA